MLINWALSFILLTYRVKWNEKCFPCEHKSDIKVNCEEAFVTTEREKLIMNENLMNVRIEIISFQFSLEVLNKNDHRGCFGIQDGRSMIIDVNENLFTDFPSEFCSDHCETFYIVSHFNHVKSNALQFRRKLFVMKNGIDCTQVNASIFLPFFDWHVILEVASS